MDNVLKINAYMTKLKKINFKSKFLGLKFFRK